MVPHWTDLQGGDRPGLRLIERQPWLNIAPVASGVLPDLRRGNMPHVGVQVKHRWTNAHKYQPTRRFLLFYWTLAAFSESSPGTFQGTEYLTQQELKVPLSSREALKLPPVCVKSDPINDFHCVFTED